MGAGWRVGITASLATLIASPALAQSQSEMDALKAELGRARAEIQTQQQRLREQEDRLKAIEARMSGPAPAGAGASATFAAPPTVASPPAGPSPAVAAAQGSASTVAGDPATVQQAPVERVGQAPAEADRPPEVAVLGDQGSIVTRRGQLTAETQFEYARADRNRALFRGIEVVESVLVGVFDINESRQDVLTAAGSLRYGLFSNLEIGARLPYIYRSDKSVLAPVMGSGTSTGDDVIDSSASGNGIGDLELSARYQITSARGGWPFLIGNLQVVVPTGTDPFEIRRNQRGEALEAATGAGFWGVSPSVTAILPTDPAVLFGTIGYTRNFGRAVDTLIPPARITYVKPGDALSFSAGIGLSLNQRTSLNLGYAHSWAFGTKTRTQLLETTGSWSTERTTRARDLQLGRLLFGITYRLNNRTSLNWSVEVGATEDATDLRTVLRIPLVLLTGG